MSKSMLVIAALAIVFSVNLFLIRALSSAEEKFPLIKAGTLTRDETWCGRILVTEDVIIPEGVSLTIEPGTVVSFKHYRGYKEPWRRVGMRVEGGTLKAVGTPREQIWFTSDADNPINGDWQGISLSNTKNSRFDYVIVEFGEIGIEQFDSEVTISNSIIRWNNTEGLYAERSKPIFKNNTLYGNGYHEIALEQYNQNVQILYNIIRDGHYGVHCEKTTAYLEGNYFKNEEFEAITAGMESHIVVKRNKFENIGHDPPISVYNGSTAEIEGNDYGEGNIPIPEFDYEDIKHFELGYVPGDPEDRYLYIYDEVDETRRTIKKIGQGLGFGWALVYAENNLWRFSLGSGEVGESLDFIKVDPVTGDYQRYGNDEIMNPRGLAYDGEYFWVNDFSLLKIFKFKLHGNFIEILDSFDIPEKEKGGTSGLTTDGDFLYLRSRDGSKLYKLDKNGNLIGEIHFQTGGIGNALVWTGNYFWTSGGCKKGICKFTKEGKLVGGIYPPAKDTWALAWDGNYLWSIQRTCEMWNDPKIYQIEILNDSFISPELNSMTLDMGSILSGGTGIVDHYDFGEFGTTGTMPYIYVQTATASDSPFDVYVKVTYPDGRSAWLYEEAGAMIYHDPTITPSPEYSSQVFSEGTVLPILTWWFNPAYKYVTNAETGGYELPDGVYTWDIYLLPAGTSISSPDDVAANACASATASVTLTTDRP